MFDLRLKKCKKNGRELRAGSRPKISAITDTISSAIIKLPHKHRNNILKLSNKTAPQHRATGKPFFHLLLVIVLLMFGITQNSFATDRTPHPFVVSGVIINSHNADLIERFARYLSEKSGYPLQVVYVNKYAELSRVLREDPKAVGWTCGAPYVQDSKTNGQKLVAVPLFNKKPTYHSLVLARSDRTEKTLADFKDGVLAYSDSRSNSGYLAPRYVLHKQGIDINKHFRLLLNTGSHEGSIKALIHNLADVAAVDEYIWQAYLKEHPEAGEKLREIERMGPFPFTPIVSGVNVDDDEINQLSSALLGMDDNAEGQKLLSEFYLDGFVEKKPAFYQPIKNMLEEVNIESRN